MGQFLEIALVIFVCLAVVTAPVWVFLIARRSEKRQQKAVVQMQEQTEAAVIAAVPDFSPQIRYEQDNGLLTLFLDPDSSQFAVARIDGSVRAFHFSQLVDVQIERNGSALELTNRGSQMVGAAVGGAVFGIAGAIIGGLSGSKRHIERIKRLSLKVYTNDPHEPVIDIVFFEDPQGLDADGPMLPYISEELEQWYGRFLTIKAGQQTAQASTPQDDAQASSFGRAEAWWFVERKSQR